LSTKLKEKGYESDDIDKAVGKLEELKYLNDYRFCDAFIRSKKNGNGWGESRIRLELKMKHGIDENIIDDLMPEYDFEKEKIKRYIKKFGKTNPVDNKDYQKRARFLASRGFSFKLPSMDDMENFEEEDGIF
jgi:regulatory protein